MTDYNDAIELDPNAHPTELQPGEVYRAEVNNTVDYGVFVDLTPSHGSDISGLVHSKNLLPNTLVSDYAPGQELAVELLERKPNGDLSFRAIHSPDLDFARDQPPTDQPAANGGSAIAGDVTVISSDGAMSSVRTPIRDAIATLDGLRSRGYRGTEYDLHVRDAGETVRIEIEVSKERESE